MQAQLRDLCCPISGTASEMPQFQLHNNGDIIRNWQFLLNLNAKPGINQPRNEFTSEVASNVAQIREMASIPVIPLHSIGKKIDALLGKYRSLQKSHSRDSGKPMFEEKLSSFRVHLDEIFEVPSCRCEM